MCSTKLKVLEMFLRQLEERLLQGRHRSKIRKLFDWLSLKWLPSLEKPNRLFVVGYSLATSCEELTHWKRLWCWEGWGQEEKGMTEDEIAGWHHGLDGRESEWTPGVGWWTGRPGMLQFTGSQRVRHDWATELNWTEQKQKILRRGGKIHIRTIQKWSSWLR